MRARRGPRPGRTPAGEERAPVARLAMLAVLISVAGLSGCEREPPAVVHEVDGVPLVESHRPVWGGRAPWSIDPEPTLRIPSWSAPHGRDSIHLADATRLADGTVIVANGHTGEIGWFDRDGRPVRRVGGGGTGAGEFQSLQQVIAIHDSLWAFDGMGRWNVFDLRGDLLATLYLEPHGGGWTGMEALTASGFLLVPDLVTGHPSAAGSGRVRPAMPILRYTRAGHALDTLAVVPGPERTILSVGSSTMHMLGPFDAWTVLAGGAERFYLGTGERMEIEVYDEEGLLERILRVPGLDLALPEEEWAAYVEERASSFVTRLTPEAADRLRALPKPETRPAYSRFLEDGLGNLWVAEHVVGTRWGVRRPATSWHVFDPDGRWLGRLRTPAGLHVVEIGADYLLGIQRTPEGTEVRLHSLSRR